MHRGTHTAAARAAAARSSLSSAEDFLVLAKGDFGKRSFFMAAARRRDAGRSGDGGWGWVARSEPSLERVRAFALVFSRWTEETGRNHAVPQPFLDTLTELVVESEVKLRCGSSFYLRCKERRDSSATTLIYQFTAKSDTTLVVSFVRANDTDTHEIDLEHGVVQSEHGHWMAGSRHHASKQACSGTAPRVLACWWDTLPSTLQRDGRARYVRPCDLSAPPMALCDSARHELSSGRTLLLCVGALARVDAACCALPNAHDLFVGGFIFRDATPAEQTRALDDAQLAAERCAVELEAAAHASPAEAAGSHAAIDAWCSSWRAPPSGGPDDDDPLRGATPLDKPQLVLHAVIVAERATRNARSSSGLFDGTSAGRPTYRNDGLPVFTDDGVFDWQAHDVYLFGSGEWSHAVLP
jgi:hypothetical protein